MDATADRDGFVAVYPDATGRGTRALSWNAGGCCAYAARKKIDETSASPGRCATRRALSYRPRRHAGDRRQRTDVEILPRVFLVAPD
jgi:hypothetical protein